eukprot:gene7944-10779_t
MPSSEAAHEFGALNTLLLCVILGLCVLSAYLIKQNSFYYLPESAAAILVGLMVGCLARAVFPSIEELNFLTFEPQLFFFLLLPPIIFEAGYSLKKKDFFANFWTISLYAVFGTVISTFIIGYLVYGAGLLGLVTLDTSSPLEGLLFGSLISAVDPVATLSIMGNPELNCDPLLYSLVFGESVLNDAVAIVLFKTFMDSYESSEEFSAKSVSTVLLNFTFISLGSVVVGVLIGLICCYLCKHTQMKKYPEYEISMLFLFAYGSFSFSESIQLSGIMSLFFCGIILSHYNSHNLSSTSQVTAHNIFKSLAVLSEYFVFLYLGMGLFTGKFKRLNVLFFILCMIFCLAARIFNIFPLSFLANLGRGRNRAISLPMQGVIWFAGLRGAISFALSQNMPGDHKDLYISTTLSIVIFTTIVCGGLTEPFMKRMGMRKPHPQLQSSNMSSVPSTPSNTARLNRNRSHHRKIEEADISNLILEHNFAIGTTNDEETSIPLVSTDTNLIQETHNEEAELLANEAMPSDKTLTENAVNDINNGSNGLSRSISDTVARLGFTTKTYLHRFEMEFMQPVFGGSGNDRHTNTQSMANRSNDSEDQ